MSENEIKNVAENMFNVLRLFQSKMFRPFELAIKSDLSPTQFRILGLLKEKTSMTMTELANEMLISKQQLTPVIDKLIEGHLVARENDKNDRRIIKISLEADGKKLLQARTKEILELLSEKFRPINPEEIEKLDVALRQVCEILVKLD